jgi:hypothetical protein
MTLRSAALVASLAMATACHAGDAADARHGAPAAAAQRLDGIFQGCGGAPRSAGNPFGLREDQSRSPEGQRAFIRETLSRALAIERATAGPVRILFHQPAGWFLARKWGMRGAVPTVPLMNGRLRSGRELYPWRWAVWAEELGRVAREHPDWILGVYFSGQVPAADAADALDAKQAWAIYDHENARHRSLLLGVVDQWRAVGVREFVLDGSHAPEFSGGMPALAAAIHAKGGRLYVESHPRTPDGRLRMSLLDRIDGSLATHHFMVNHEPASLAWVVPPGKVMMVALTGHATRRKPGRTTPTPDDVEGYRARGFSVLSGRQAFDAFVSRPAPAQ